VWVILSYILIHQIEAHLIQPLVMSRAVSLHPVVVILAILVMGTLFGFIGLLLGEAPRVPGQPEGGEPRSRRNRAGDG
jgi:predicted PurR-regulated permease PerM